MCMTVHPTLPVGCMPRGQLRVSAVRMTRRGLEREEDDGMERMWSPEGREGHRLGMWLRGQQESHMDGLDLSHSATLCGPPPNANVPSPSSPSSHTRVQSPSLSPLPHSW